jgi:hypothetical protein
MQQSTGCAICRGSFPPTSTPVLTAENVVDYAQWRSRDAFEAMLRNPDARPHMTRAAALASFDPILCEVAYVDHA